MQCQLWPSVSLREATSRRRLSECRAVKGFFRGSRCFFALPTRVPRTSAAADSSLRTYIDDGSSSRCIGSRSRVSSLERHPRERRFVAPRNARVCLAVSSFGGSREGQASSSFVRRAKRSVAFVRRRAVARSPSIAFAVLSRLHDSCMAAPSVARARWHLRDTMTRRLRRRRAAPAIARPLAPPRDRHATAT